EHSPLPNRKGQTESSLGNVRGELMIGPRPFRLAVSHIEWLVVLCAWKPHAQNVPNCAVRTVTAAQVRSVPGFFTGRCSERGSHAVVPLSETSQLGVPLNALAGKPKALGQQPLVVILGEAQDERKRANIAAHVSERDNSELSHPVAEMQ